MTTDAAPSIPAFLRYLTIAAVSVAAFLACMRNPPLWDDAIILNQRLSPQDCTGFADIWQHSYFGNAGRPDTYRPLGLSLIYAEKLAFGDNMAGYHVVSLGLNALVSLTALWLLTRLIGPTAGWCAALLLAAHPIHAEAVAMVYGQLELQAGLFTLLALALYDRATQSDRFLPIDFGLSIVCAAAAICCKESGIMIPALVLLLRASRAFDVGMRRAADYGWRDIAFWLVPIPYLMLRYHALGMLAPAAESTLSMNYPMAARLKLLIVSAGEAIRLCVFPTGQTVYYGHLRDSIFGRPYGETAWIAAAVLVLYSIWPTINRRVILLGVGWFAVTFFPVSNIVPSGVVVAERTLYLPVMGVCLLVVVWLQEMLGAKKTIVASAILVAISIFTANAAVAQWSSDTRLWRTTVAAHPRSPMGFQHLGGALVNSWAARSGRDIPADELTEAANAFQTAYLLNPANTEALTGSAIVAIKQGDFTAAIGYLNQALEQDPHNAADAALLSECRARMR